MAVKVMGPGTPTAARTTTHDEGAHVQIANGHLIVLTSEYTSSAQTVAVYAPGAWQKAVVEREKKD